MDEHRQLERHWSALERGDEKAVHEVRKLSRRAGAVLRALGAPKKVQRAWRAIRRAVAPLRDWDVLFEHLCKRLQELKSEPATLQAFEEDWRLEREKRFGYLVLPALPPSFSPPRDAHKLLEEELEDNWPKLRRMAKRILPLEPSAAWHDWRKKLKGYRHLLEALERDTEDLEALLRSLGRIQDAEVIVETLADRELLPSVHQGLRDQIATLERETLAREADKVRERWARFKAAGGGLEG